MEGSWGPVARLDAALWATKGSSLVGGANTMIVQELPKTRSGKIMRRLLRDVAENRELGDVTTLTDSSVMNLIKEKLPAAPSED